MRIVLYALRGGQAFKQAIVSICKAFYKHNAIMMIMNDDYEKCSIICSVKGVAQQLEALLRSGESGEGLEEGRWRW